MLNIFKSIFGDKHTKDIKKLAPRVETINEYYNQYSTLTNDQLRAKTEEFRSIINADLKSINEEINELKKKTEEDTTLSLADKDAIYNTIDEKHKERLKQLEEVLDNILEQAFAVVKETARRFTENDQLTVTATDLDRELEPTSDHIQINGNQATYATNWQAAGNQIDWNMIHYDVQLIGGMVLHQGKVAEMATGEGKTLVATLPAYLNGIAGFGVHVVTVNNYLSQRDAEWMAPVMEFLGLTVDCIDKHKPHSEARKKAYEADLVYGTNNEFGFDYLRDNMVRTQKELSQGKHHYAMIDEVDSILIDDARTPLITSGPVPKGDDQQYDELKPRIQSLFEAQKKIANKFLVQAKKEIAEDKADQNTGGLALLRAHRALPKSKPLIKYLSEQGIRTVLQKVESYYMQEQEKNMPLVDEELYFVIDEKKNSVELTDKGIEYLTLADENPDFFVIPEIGTKLDAIDNSSSTDEEKAIQKDELFAEYSLKSERLHSVHQLLKAYALFEKDIEYVVVDNQVKIVDEQTGRIMDGRRYSDGLHQAIEAKESVKIEAATQTFATITLQNYFRMYHKLAGMTGTAETEASELWDIYELDVVTIPTNKPIIRDDKVDKIYKTAKEKYSAVIDEIELMREQGRPILVGTSSVDSSELVSKLLNMRSIPHNVLNAKNHQREADIVAEAGNSGSVTIATNMAGRGTDIKLGEGVREAGGLAIIGTERHDSRRVDRQLRGRAGRQGDPGSSQFFLSLEDNLLRIFGSERMSTWMDRLGHQEGDVIQSKMISRQVETSQKKVEENNYGIRKRLLEYDDVMNNQRTIIYKRRKNALEGERLAFDLANLIYDLVEELINTNIGVTAYDEFKIEVLRLLSLEVPFTEQDWNSGNNSELADQLYEAYISAFQRKKDQIVETAMPLLDNIYRDRGDTVKRIAIPFDDGSKVINTVVDLEQTIEDKGESIIKELEKTTMLSIIDSNWKEHLRAMDDLRTSVQLATYEQKDPLLIYKFEAFQLFKAMLDQINKEVAAFLLRAELPKTEQNVSQAREQRTDLSKMKTNKSAEDSRSDEFKGARTNRATGQPQKKEPVLAGPKVGRNDPCPCGSGKKYKKCHGK